MAAKTAEVIDIKALREKLRNKALADSPFKNKIVVYEGDDYEVREPSEGQRGTLFEAARDDATPSELKDKQKAAQAAMRVNVAKLRVWALISLVYVPGSSEHVFEPQNFDELMQRPASHLGPLKDAALEMLQAEEIAEAKNA